MLSFRVPRALKERLHVVAATSGVPMQEVARQGIETEIEVREELLDERRAAFARLAAEENSRRVAKRAKRVSNLHDDPMTP
jgi:predicted DNA-binding protein